MSELTNCDPLSTPHGSVLEASLGAIAGAVAEDPDSEILAAKARGLMIGYHARWADSGWGAVVVEPEFHLPIVNPATGCRSRTFTQAGRSDAVIVRHRRRFLLELKTTAEEIHEADAPFWRRLAVDTQTSTYALAQRQQDDPVEGVLYDVLRRPQVRPRVIPKGTPKRTDRENVGTLLELDTRGTYFGWPVEERQRKGILGGNGRETPELYSMRIAADTLRQPDRYFQRRTIKASEQQLLRHGDELWQTAVEIRLTRRAGRHYRNSDACMVYNTPCPFLPICSGRDTPDSDRWEPRRSIHPELAGVPAGVDERSVLTHSRMQCFKLCRRKHHYRYELGIAPVEQPVTDTLRFSRVIRRALAAWWANVNRNGE